MFRHTVLLAPMAGAGTIALAAEVSRRGGIGGFGAGFLDGGETQATARQLARACRNRPSQMGLFVPPPSKVLESITDDEIDAARDALRPWYAALGGEEMMPSAESLAGVARGAKHRFEAQVEGLLRVRDVPIVSLHFGIDPDIVHELKHGGHKKVLATATSVHEAVLLVEAGVDGIVAQGTQAGGHYGCFDPTPSLAHHEGGRGDDDVFTDDLVADIAAELGSSSSSIPIIAAGGIMDGRDVASAVAAGADAVQMGTAFLLTSENSPAIHPLMAEWLASAGPTVRTHAISGRVARGVETPIITQGLSSTLPYPVQYALYLPLKTLALGGGEGDDATIAATRKAVLAPWAGDGVANIRSGVPARLVLSDAQAGFARRVLVDDTPIV